MESDGTGPGTGQLGLGEPVARCAEHPDQSAHTACDRCGTFTCDVCYDISPDGRALCHACQGIVGTLSIPWERDDLSFGRRVMRTVGDVVLAPGESLGRLDSGSLRQPIAFSVLAGGAAGALVMLTVPLTMVTTPGRSPWAELDPAVLWVTVGLYPVVAAGAAVAWAMVQGLLFHLGAKMVGGTGRLETSLRASCYVIAIQPVVAVLVLVGSLPLIGLVLSFLAGIFALGGPPFALHRAAEGVHGLHGARAFVPALMPLFTMLVALAFLVVLAVLVAAAP